MIDHVSIPVRDLTRAAAFYDRVLAPLSLRQLVKRERTIGYGAKYPEFWLNLRDGAIAREDSGHHVCLRAPSEAAVSEFFANALNCGGRGDGDPVPRQGAVTTYFAAFVLDPDGNKIEAVTFPRTNPTTINE